MSSPRKRPSQQRSQYTYDAVLDAATQLFERAGYAGTTTNHIAERAGVSIGSLYQYFPNKDAILYGLGERHVREIITVMSALSERMKEAAPPLEKSVRLLVNALADLHRQDPRMHRLLYDLAPRTPETAEHLRGVQALLAADVEHHLRRLDVGGPDFALTALLLAESVEAQVHGAVLDPPDPYSTEEILEAAIDLIVRGLRPTSA